MPQHWARELALCLVSVTPRQDSDSGDYPPVSNSPRDDSSDRDVMGSDSDSGDSGGESSEPPGMRVFGLQREVWRSEGAEIAAAAAGSRAAATLAAAQQQHRLGPASKAASSDLPAS